ncbi:MAG: hypothetical protein GY888_07705, partial [Planctomycetaceae bacterium]|nr:hypothetical protein [Planctomycetaceae bacterium]
MLGVSRVNRDMEIGKLIVIFKGSKSGPSTGKVFDPPRARLKKKTIRLLRPVPFQKGKIILFMKRLRDENTRLHTYFSPTMKTLTTFAALLASAALGHAALTNIPLTADLANSTVNDPATGASAHGSNLLNATSDPFAYDPDNPTANLP